MTGVVIGINIAPDKGEPMAAVQAVNAITGKGLDGDRYQVGKGAFSKHRVGETFRDVSLISVEGIEEANSEVEVKFSHQDTRRNILTKGVNLNALVGQEFLVGKVRMLGVELCDPCQRPSILSGKPGFAQAFNGRGGLRARILTNGVISVGDSIIF